MKKLTSVLVFGCFMILGFSGCKEEGCTDSFADNYNSEAGEDDGSCSYLSKFVGSYSAVYVGSGNPQYYTSIITVATNNTENGLYIFGFLPYSEPSEHVLAITDGLNLEIPNQEAAYMQIQGTGALNQNTITINCDHEDPSGITLPGNFTVTLTKQ